MMTTDGRGLYVHVPFCKQKCNYCDFCSYPGLYEAEADRYISRLLCEAREYRTDERISVDTLYFGGGTPSLLSPVQLERLIGGLRDAFDISPSAEVTVEANPGTLTADKLSGYKTLGVNRLSIGLQSIHENELKALGRIHAYDDFLAAYSLARKLGFDNVNVDLMYAIPHQTRNSLAATLDAVCALEPEHISAYGLIVEEGTPFFENRGELKLPGDDEEYEMYLLVADRLRRSGYSHYEISAYSKPGRESAHNLKYWHNEEYVGLGAAAYSYLGGVRYGNVRSLSRYMSGAPRENTDVLDKDGEMFEYAMMHLRLAEGISLAEYEARYGIPFTRGREDKLRSYISAGLMVDDPDRVALTERGFYISNAIMAQIL